MVLSQVGLSLGPCPRTFQVGKLEQDALLAIAREG